MDWQEKITRRQEYNLKILDVIKECIEKSPNMRLIQILWSLGIINSDTDGIIIDKFYEEPVDTFNNLKFD